MGAASLVNRDTLTAEIAALYNQLDLHDAVVADYQSLEEVCRDQKLQLDRMQTMLQSYVDLAPRLATFVQQRHLRLWNNNQNSIERPRGFHMELVRRLGHDHVVRDLKTSF